ncbi:MAG: hypothetical protein AAF654_10740 [Myxococcota bacterium]
MTVNGLATQRLEALCLDLLTRFDDTEGLQRTSVPALFSERTGSFKGVGFTLTTQAFRSDEIKRLVFARIVDDEGSTRSVTVIGFPTDTSALPILGVDMIAFGRALSLVALDYAPTNATYWRDVAEPVLARLGAQAFERLKRRKRPEFTRGSFSEAAIIAASPPGTEGAACDAAKALVARYLEMPTRGDSYPSAPADQSVEHWCAAELGNRKEHDALAGIFGESFAEAYLGFLFGGDERPHTMVTRSTGGECHV